jgi:hypothetical protein
MPSALAVNRFRSSLCHEGLKLPIARFARSVYRRLVSSSDTSPGENERLQFTTNPCLKNTRGSEDG